MGPVIYPNEWDQTSFKIMPSTVLQTQSLEQFSEELPLSPLIFQKLYERERDLRVVLVGRGETAKCFTASIDIVKSKSIDWREYQTETAICYIDLQKLNPSLYQSLLQYHSKSLLSYGAYDIILSKEGDKEVPIFLECNPIGNWLWIENALPDQLPISDAIAKMLLRS